MPRAVWPDGDEAGRPGKLNRGYLPHVFPAVAQEARVSLKEFNSYPIPVQRAWLDYMLNGPSEFRSRLHTLELVNLQIVKMTAGKKNPGIAESGILDGMTEHPEAARERRRVAQEEASLDAHMAEVRRIMGLDGGAKDEA